MRHIDWVTDTPDSSDQVVRIQDAVVAFAVGRCGY
jgi:hypothetical protein